MAMDPSTIEWKRISANVRLARDLQKLTRIELAKRARIDVSTLYRLERGRSIRVGSLRKVADALDIPVDWFFVDRSTSPSNPCLVHRSSQQRWFPLGERRAIEPGPDFERFQAPEERRRLGMVGLVAAVASPGVGSTRIEVYGRFEQPFNDETHERACICVLCGRIVVTVEDQKVTLVAGDQVNYRCEALRSVEFQAPPENEEAPAVLLWTGIEPIRRKRTRRRSK